MENAATQVCHWQQSGWVRGIAFALLFIFSKEAVTDDLSSSCFMLPVFVRWTPPALSTRLGSLKIEELYYENMELSSGIVFLQIHWGVSIPFLVFAFLTRFKILRRENKQNANWWNAGFSWLLVACLTLSYGLEKRCLFQKLCKPNGQEKGHYKAEPLMTLQQW